MNRRAFITLLGGAAAWPLAARATVGAAVGLLYSQSPDTFADLRGFFSPGPEGGGLH
jgi:hypothetical protein